MDSLIKIIVFGILISLCGCSAIAASGAKQQSTDYRAIVESLLAIKSDRFTFIDNQGNTQHDSLAQYKELEEIYGRYITPEKINTELSEEQIKIIMLFAFYAQHRNSGAFSEYLATDLMPVYVNNRALFVSIMKELPYLIPSTCDRLNAYFGFEGKHLTGKDSFVNDNKTYFETHLEKAHSEACLKQFSE